MADTSFTGTRRTKHEEERDSHGERDGERGLSLARLKRDPGYSGQRSERVDRAPDRPPDRLPERDLERQVPHELDHRRDRAARHVHRPRRGLGQPPLPRELREERDESDRERERQRAGGRESAAKR